MIESAKNFLNKNKKWLVLTLTIFLLLIIIVYLTASAMDLLYKDKFYPGVKISGVSLSGLTQPQAEKIFQAKINELDRRGQNFNYKNQQVKIYPISISASDPDLTHPLVEYDLKSSLHQAYSLGRGKTFFDSLWQKIKLIFVNKHFFPTPKVDDLEIYKILKNNLTDLEDPASNPQLIFEGDNISVSQEKSGLSFNYQLAIDKLKNNLSHFDFADIELELKFSQPDFNQAQAMSLIDKVEPLLQLAPIKITATTTNEYNQTSRHEWLVEKNELKKWLNLGWRENKPSLIIEPLKFKNFINSISFEIERPAQEAKFEINDGRVVKFQASRAGQEIDFNASLKNTEQAIVDHNKTTAEIVIKQKDPNTTTQDVNDLGIKELIGIGKSNFSGSPVNRRHNIKVGAESLNGLLIEPGAEFSVNEALGDINAAKGYLPELVIKGNRTIPEYGGGLCQIATTAFRLAVNSGLPITERKPHAYRVSYYEPAGTDATIYSPHPDFRFTNDTPHTLLIQTKIDDNEVIFEMWGTDDGRQVSTTTPSIWNITYPGETKYVETTDLPPEKINCIESAHNGAEAEFSRTIIYANGETNTESWYSKYRPWQAVCLVGVDPTKIATSTDETIKSGTNSTQINTNP